jgi:FkbM family methyltransferase
MGLESRLRNLIVRTPLAESQAIGRLYAAVNRVRYARSWDAPVDFRGGRFSIGKDLGLYPFVRAGGFEERELDWLLPRIRPTDVVWDVGANIGIYTVLMAQRAARVVAFEPMPETFGRLQHNVALNGIDNVDLVNAALSDAPGRARMLAMPEGPGGNHLLRDGHDAGTVEVEVLTGDGYVDEHRAAPDVIKVDIEGFEPEFVRGSLRMIRTRRPLLTLEVNRTTMLEPDRQANWQSAIDELFDIYRTAIWFGGSGAAVSVTQLRPDGMPLRPCTLAFGGGERGVAGHG